MDILHQSLKFILSKWNLSLEEFKPIGKFLFYVPNLLNNVLTLLWYFLLFPIVCLYIYLMNRLDELTIK